MIIATIESDHKIQLPAEWLDELGFQGLAALEKSPDGVVVRCYSMTWDEVFADKLPIGSPVTGLNLSEVSGDAYVL